jgi:hypothetical protein
VGRRGNPSQRCRLGMIRFVPLRIMMCDALMRTTVALPDDLHRAARSLAHDRGQSLSQTVSELVRRGLGPTTEIERVSLDAATGLPLVRLGTPVTTDMARAAADDE